MRLLIDEQLSPAIAEQLRKRGYAAVAVRDEGLAGKNDGEILDWATLERRAVVTSNIQDFRPLHAARLSGLNPHFGIVLVSARKYRLGKEFLGPLIDALTELLKANTADDALLDVERFL